jgi:hypothetical protein
MKAKVATVGVLVAICGGGASAAESLSWGGFVDVYGAYDFNHPPTIDRSFTTQAARDREFNVNLAYVEAKLARPRTHGRLALQAGTSVQNNTAGEPTVGTVSGPSLSRHLQEAYVGYRAGEGLWIDAGIFFSHIGLESFVSKDNLTYTRSLVADYSPYYQAGVRVTKAWESGVSAQLHLLNGWQNISESNAEKAIGTQIAYAFSPATSLSYSTFFGREAGFRHFHDLVAKWSPNPLWTWGVQADVGFQDRGPGVDAARWYGFALIARRAVGSAGALAARVEHYADPNQVLVTTSSGEAFSAWGLSLGFDLRLDEGVWWRNEWRGLAARNSVFSSADGMRAQDHTWVSALAMEF